MGVFFFYGTPDITIPLRLSTASTNNEAVYREKDALKKALTLQTYRNSALASRLNPLKPHNAMATLLIYATSS